MVRHLDPVDRDSNDSMPHARDLSWSRVFHSWLQRFLRDSGRPVGFSPLPTGGTAGCPSGQWERTVNPSAHAYEGSNPSPATRRAKAQPRSPASAGLFRQWFPDRRLRALPLSRQRSIFSDQTLCHELLPELTGDWRVQVGEVCSPLVHGTRADADVDYSRMRRGKLHGSRR